LLEQLVLKGFLRCHRKYYGFMHHLLAIVVYSSIPAEVRRHIHHDLAEYLRETEAPVTTIAYHSYEGDDGPLAIDELDRAGALAKQCLDLGAASHYYSRALDIVRREWGRGRLRETDLDQMAVDLARRLAEVLQRKGDTLAARGVLEETLSVAAAEESSRASLRLDLGRIDLELGNLQRALRHFELAYSDAEQADSPWLLGEVSRELARVVGLLNDTDRAMDLLIKSLVNSDMVSGSKQGPSWNTFWEVATICTQNGFLERSRGYLLDALEQAENERSVWGKLKIVTGMAEAHLASSEWSEAEMRLTQALDLVTQVGDRTRKTKLLIELGRVYRIQGQVELGRKMLESAVRYAKALSWWEGLKQADREIDMLKFAIPQAL
jgi:tetratricopeptide (TPR) repeat protein